MDPLQDLVPVLRIIDRDHRFFARGPRKEISFGEMVPVLQMVLVVRRVEFSNPLLLEISRDMELDHDEPMVPQEIIFILISHIVHDTMSVPLSLRDDILDPDLGIDRSHLGPDRYQQVAVFSLHLEDIGRKVLDLLTDGMDRVPRIHPLDRLGQRGLSRTHLATNHDLHSIIYTYHLVFIFHVRDIVIQKAT
jgi:hypothetical protein